MSKFMSFETFKESYIGAIASGVDMLCCFWNDDGEQVNMNWHPYTADIHNQVRYEAEEYILKENGIDESDDDYEDALDAAIDEVIDSYKTVLEEAARKAYEEYIGDDDEEDFEFSERFGEW